MQEHPVKIKEPRKTVLIRKVAGPAHPGRRGLERCGSKGTNDVGAPPALCMHSQKVNNARRYKMKPRHIGITRRCSWSSMATTGAGLWELRAMTDGEEREGDASPRTQTYAEADERASCLTRYSNETHDGAHAQGA
ncbi:hypothetical protein B0H11DRAFT_1941101 [Mycena galericulata]|nr:hypothetical protein B0H11DRAFT_1941101 [Mycena galericulata]